jgi:hypothetical protein
VEGKRRKGETRVEPDCSVMGKGIIFCMFPTDEEGLYWHFPWQSIVPAHTRVPCTEIRIHGLISQFLFLFLVGRAIFVSALRGCRRQVSCVSLTGCQNVVCCKNRHLLRGLLTVSQGPQMAVESLELWTHQSWAP